MKCFYVITNKQKDSNLETTKRVSDFLESRGAICYVQTDETVCDIPENVECVIVLGGDGTLLQAARDMVEKDIPLLGINLGTLGYLAEVEKSNIEAALEKLMQGMYEIEERMMLTGQAVHEGTVIEDAYALNDVVITRAGSLRIININIYINGQLLNNYSADGVIISTPTGSTGYNMSAGGPIVEPKAKLMVITPICPHTLNTRSIILSAEDQVMVEIDKGKIGMSQEVAVSFDGNCSTTMITGDTIQITQSKKKTRIVKLSRVSFLATLHKKMKENFYET